VTEKLPAVTPKQLIRVLGRRGWEVDRVRGSHHVVVHREEQRVLVIPMHSRDLKVGTLLALLRNAGIERDEFLRLLRRERD
jgi:predicted RNA binding protein YcfA (HicA-like mRNA interferase family)